MITKDPYGALTSWNDSLNFCDWAGVTCGKRHRRVTSLRLLSQGLEGFLSPHLGNLSFLRVLVFYNNSFQGAIPHELGRLSRLSLLSLYKNKFNAVIPTNISRCSSLEKLDLSNNELVGSIPKDISFLSKLTFLSLGDNKLTGGIPPFLGNLTSMEKFSVTNSPLGGSIPNTLGHWKNLAEFYSYNCNLHGSIPYEFSRLSRLRVLYLGYNKFSGTILANISSCSNLETLDLSRNELVGSIPKEMALLSKLSFLSLSNNKLTSGIPSFLGNLTSMEVFVVNDNPLGGSIPNTLGYWKNFKEIYAGSCNLYGMIPRSIYNLSLLASLSLPYNQLTDSLPPTIGAKFPRFVFFELQGNQLTGPLPTFIVNCSKLEYLDVGENKLSGKVAIDFSKLRDVRFIRLSKNLFGSKEDDELKFIDSLKNCTRLEKLGLDNCKFQGVIPRSIEGNRFIGNIPSSIGNLQKLQMVGLDKNQFSGKIPNAIGNLSLLIKLYLSSNMLEGLRDNKLSGEIPTQVLQLSSLSILLDLSHNNLCGSLPIEVGDLNTLSVLDLSYNNLSGNIPSSVGGCESLLKLSLRGNLFRGQISQFFERFLLESLDISYNDFEGEIPVLGVFANASAFSFSGNSKLCGGVIGLRLPKCKEQRNIKRKFHTFIIVILTASTLLTVIFLAYVWYKKKRKIQLAQSSTSKNVSYNQLLKATDGFSEANLIGNGGFGSVYKGILDEDNDKFVAIKVLHLQNRGAERSFMRECEAWRNIRHRNLLKILTLCSSIDFQGNDFKALVYEFMPNGSLHDWLHSSERTPRLNLRKIINILTDVAYALDYIHNQCIPIIVHGDLKPSNILLDDDMVAHVGDFGLARFFGTSYPNSSTGIRGTIGYAAPEYGLGNEMTTSGDAYSFGILLLEVMTGKSPTDDIFNENLSLHKFASAALQD
ncbi:hypothetical protein M8C21_013227, partial [Ambrosia artemisiifolia]